MARYRLINIGRNKFNGEVSVNTENELLRELKLHLHSYDIGILWHGKLPRAGTVTAGFHSVGRVEEILEPSNPEGSRT